jgi:hypothetical protein
VSLLEALMCQLIHLKTSEASADASQTKVHIRGTLCNQIGEFQTEIQRQERIIAALGSCHVLEYLPPPGNGSATQKWKESWANAWKKAQHDPNHPLHKLRTDPNEKFRERVEKIGSLLYDTFSTNIHKYHTSVELSELQRNIDERGIMSALSNGVDLSGEVEPKVW